MGQLLFYESLGKGTPVVLLHGLALDHTIWYPVANLLKDEFHVVLPDLRGHGRSFSPPGRYSMDQMAEDMLQLVDYLNLERFFLGGHSMGGYVALNFAKNHPDRLLNLGLIASHIYADSTEKSEQRLQQIEKLEHESPAVIFSIMLHGLTRNETVRQFCDEIIEDADPHGMQGVLFAMAKREDSKDINKKLDQPVLIIAGMDDQFIPLEKSREMADEIHTPNLVEVEGAGHMVMMEKPAVTANSIKKYLK